MVAEITDRINMLFNYMHVDTLKNDCRVKASDFTRKCSLNFVNLILLILTKSGLTNTMELIKYFDDIGCLVVSKEAFSIARLKLKSIVFKKLKVHYLTMVYENKKKLKMFKNHVLLACDGSKVELPHHKSLIKIYGGVKNKFKEIKSCMGNSGMIYDVLNRYVFDFEIDEYITSEKVLVLRNLVNIV
jgi:hypothetical protein